MVRRSESQENEILIHSINKELRTATPEGQASGQLHRNDSAEVLTQSRDANADANARPQSQQSGKQSNKSASRKSPKGANGNADDDEDSDIDIHDITA